GYTCLPDERQSKASTSVTPCRPGDSPAPAPGRSNARRGMRADPAHLVRVPPGAAGGVHLGRRSLRHAQSNAALGRRVAADLVRAAGDAAVLPAGPHYVLGRIPPLGSAPLW